MNLDNAAGIILTAFHTFNEVERIPSSSEAAALAAEIVAAALDPHDRELQGVILGAMGFYADAEFDVDFSGIARVQARDAIAAMRKHIGQGGQQS